MTSYSDPVGQVLPFQDLPDRTTPVRASWYQQVHDTLTEAYGAAGRVVFDVRDYGAVGDGATDDTAAFTAASAAAVAAGGARVRVPACASSYVVAGVPLQPGVYWEGDGWAASKCRLPTGSSASMFVAPVAAVATGGGMRGLHLHGGGVPTATTVAGIAVGTTGTGTAIDFRNVDALESWELYDTFVEHFAVGYSGAVAVLGDRYIPISGNRFWNCTTGVYIASQHPNFGINEIRYCNTGLSGNLLHTQFTGTKFNYNVVGVDGSAAIESTWTNCQFYGNSDVAIRLGTQCTLAGSLVGSSAAQTTAVFVDLYGSQHRVTGNRFTSFYSTAAVRWVLDARQYQTVISGNHFEQGVAVPAILMPAAAVGSGTGDGVYQPLIADNTFNVTADAQCLLANSGKSFVHPTVKGNQVRISVVNTNPLFSMPSTNISGYVFSHNTVFGDGVTGGAVLSSSQSVRAIVTDNRLRSMSATPFTLGSTDADTRIRNNYGYPTQTRGSATVTSAATSVTVTHGLARTPNIADIFITPQASLGSAARFWVSGVTSTQFVINVDAAPGAGVAFGWHAEAEIG